MPPIRKPEQRVGQRAPQRQVVAERACRATRRCRSTARRTRLSGAGQDVGRDLEDFDRELPDQQQREEAERCRWRCWPAGRGGGAIARWRRTRRPDRARTARAGCRSCSGPSSSRGSRARSGHARDGRRFRRRSRGRGRSTAISRTMRPGRADITTTRSPRNTASSIEWVISTTVLRLASQMRCSSAFIFSRVSASSAPNGSSISSSFGSRTSARTMATRCCMPPDNSYGYLFSKPMSPAMRSRSRTAPSRSPIWWPPTRSGTVTFCQTVSQGSSVACWNTTPTSADGPSMRVSASVNGAGVGAVEAGEQPQQRALAAAGRADQADEFAVAHRHVETGRAPAPARPTRSG